MAIWLQVRDAGGITLPNATVNLSITGPATQQLTSELSNSSGMSEASWVTIAPNKRGTGGISKGNCTVTVQGVNASGFTWDGNQNTGTFVLN